MSSAPILPGDFSWNDFPYQLQFLALYSGNTPTNRVPWEIRLNEAVEATRERFLYYGFIEPVPRPSPDEVIRSSSVEALKDWCREGGLKVSGKRSEIAERVISARVEAAFLFAKRLSSDSEQIFQLTDAGRELTDAFLSRSPWGFSDDWFDHSSQAHLRAKSITNAQFRQRCDEMMRVGIKSVEIVGSGNPGEDCAACLALKDHRLPIGAIVLPLAECDRARCKCIVIAAG